MRTTEFRTKAVRTKKTKNAPTKAFDLTVDNTPVEVIATPFVFNEETRFRVSYNGSPVHIFAWDSSLHKLAAIDDNAEMIPDSIENAIAEKLQRMAA